MTIRSITNVDGTAGEQFIFLNHVEAVPLLAARWQGEILCRLGVAEPHESRDDDPCWTARPVIKHIPAGVLLRQRWGI